MKLNHIITEMANPDQTRIRELRAEIATFAEKERTLGSKLKAMNQYAYDGIKHKKDSPEIAKMKKELLAATNAAAPLRKELRKLNEAADDNKIARSNKNLANLMKHMNKGVNGLRYKLEATEKQLEMHDELHKDDLTGANILQDKIKKLKMEIAKYDA